MLPIHILWGLLACPTGPHRADFTPLGLVGEDVMSALEEFLAPKRPETEQVELVATGPACKAIVASAIENATGEGEVMISTRHLLAALLGINDSQVETFIRSVQ